MNIEETMVKYSTTEIFLSLTRSCSDDAMASSIAFKRHCHHHHHHHRHRVQHHIAGDRVTAAENTVHRSQMLNCSRGPISTAAAASAAAAVFTRGANTPT